MLPFVGYDISTAQLPMEFYLGPAHKSTIPSRSFWLLDSDCASYPMSRYSSISYYTMIGNSPISWKTKKQAMSLAFPMKQNIDPHGWISLICSTSNSTPFTIFFDNKSALRIARNPGLISFLILEFLQLPEDTSTRWPTHDKLAKSLPICEAVSKKPHIGKLSSS